MTDLFKHCLSVVLTILLIGCEPAPHQGSAPAGAGPDVSAGDAGNWPRYGRSWEENHYSPLSQINDSNIDRLGLTWFYDLPMAPSSGVTAPLAIDGTLYFSVGLSVIHAMDAATGEVLWRYDPEVHKVAGREMRGGWGVRGIAYSDGKVFSGTLDGRLIALDAAAGKLLWSAETTGDDDGRYITGMPYVMADKVIIGHGGADFAPVRGYVTAYDANSGEQLWRFYTVPGDPSKGFENEAMAMAAKTWNGEWWKHGGGGTVWHAMAYDPELDLVYIGTGNGAPWNRKIRSPGGGDNLFLASIIALEADSGKYVWHYQVNPGETWDFNANMDITLADLTVDGEARKVILHAPKNGFFYVIDRTNGTLISAESFAKATWAERIDTTSGRPIEVPGARYPEDTAFLMFPAAWGAHGVEAMSFNPRTGLVYLPARDKGNIYTDTDDLETWQFDRRMFISNGVGSPPADMTVPPGRGWLAAWDPLEQREVWRVDLQDTHNGGTLTTAGNLVMQGRATGEISVYAADTGEKLWSFDAQNGIMAQPITYLVDGRQHITLLVGWRGSTYEGPAGPWNYRTQKRRVLTFALDEEGQLPPVHDVSLPIVATPHFEVDEAKAVRGDALYHKTCFICHGGGLRAGGAAPDLIRSAVPTNLEALVDVVKHGSLKSRGMPQYQEFSEERIEGLLHYIRKTARERLQREQAPTSGGR